MMQTFKTKAKVEYFEATKGSWYFVMLDKNVTEELRATFSPKHGWPRIKTEVTVGKSTWPTNLFRNEDRYCLVIKKEIQKAEGLKTGNNISLTFRFP